MLYEITSIRQNAGEPKRRWFFDHFLDLTVWFGAAGEIEGFQLCYDKIQNHHALTWRKGLGFRHNRVDDGEKDGGAGGHKGIPILLPNGKFDQERVMEVFLQKSNDLPECIRKFVIDTLRTYL